VSKRRKRRRRSWVDDVCAIGAGRRATTSLRLGEMSGLAGVYGCVCVRCSVLDQFPTCLLETWCSFHVADFFFFFFLVLLLLEDCCIMHGFKYAAIWFRISNHELDALKL